MDRLRARASPSAACVTLLYGVLFGPPFAARDPLVKATATLGLLLILLGVMQWVWRPRRARLHPADDAVAATSVGDVRINWTQIIGVAFPIVVTAGTAVFLRVTKVGTAMRALANDREITAMLGVPVRRVEAAAWFGSGLVCGIAGLLLANLVGLDIVGADVPRDPGAGRGADRPARVAVGHARRRRS